MARCLQCRRYARIPSGCARRVLRTPEDPPARQLLRRVLTHLRLNRRLAGVSSVLYADIVEELRRPLEPEPVHVRIAVCPACGPRHQVIHDEGPARKLYCAERRVPRTKRER